MALIRNDVPAPKRTHHLVRMNFGPLQPHQVFDSVADSAGLRIHERMHGEIEVYALPD
jgi:hypothetical protein